MGTSGSDINQAGISIVYDPSVLGPYAGFFGGQVELKSNCRANF